MSRIAIGALLVLIAGIAVLTSGVGRPAADAPTTPAAQLDPTVVAYRSAIGNDQAAFDAALNAIDAALSQSRISADDRTAITTQMRGLDAIIRRADTYDPPSGYLTINETTLAALRACRDALSPARTWQTPSNLEVQALTERLEQCQAAHTAMARP